MLVNLNSVLEHARKEKYAVGLFNTTDTDMLQAVLDAAEETRSPVIIGTAEILLPYGELKLIAPSVIAAARRDRSRSRTLRPRPHGRALRGGARTRFFVGYV